MLSSFISNLRNYNGGSVFDDGSRDFTQNTAVYRTNSAGRFSKANGDYSDQDSAVALFSYNDANGNRRYGHLIVPKETLYERAKNPNSTIQIISSELDDGTTFGFDDTIKLLRTVDTNVYGGGADRSREQFYISFPSENEIEGSERTYFSVDDLRDAYEMSKESRDRARERRRTGLYKTPINFSRPEIRSINIPK